MSNVEYQAEKYMVQLRRPNTASPWGFRLQGGVDFSTPLSVQVVSALHMIRMVAFCLFAPPSNIIRRRGSSDVQ